MSTNTERVISIMRAFELYLEYNVKEKFPYLIEIEHKTHSLLTFYDVKVLLEIGKKLEINENKSYFSCSKIIFNFS